MSGTRHRWRRAASVGAVVLASVLAIPSSALAHGPQGGRIDLPVPRWLFVFGASAAVIVSFVALAALWKTARLERPAQRPMPDAVQRVFTSPVVEWAIRGVSLLLFLVVTVAAVAGPVAGNLAPPFVFIWFWVGLAVLHAVFGNLWATLSPWDTLARLLVVGETSRLRYPRAFGTWPAALLTLGFVWFELVYPSAGLPSTIFTAILVYTAITLGGMAVFGRQTWNQHGEAFAVYFGLLARISPFARDDRGRVVLRPVLGGLPSLRPQPGLVPFVMVILGSTTFDGVTRSSVWLENVSTLSSTGRLVAGTLGLVTSILLMSGLYALAMAAAAALSHRGWHPLSVRFVHSIVPIAFAYVLAHYFSYVLLEGQGGLGPLSDPLGLGWNLFGTAGWGINYDLVSVTTVWYVQVAAIVSGHIAGVVLAHDRAIAAFRSGRAVRTQYALLAVMVAFTVGGLLILSGG